MSEQDVDKILRTLSITRITSGISTECFSGKLRVFCRSCGGSILEECDELRIDGLCSFCYCSILASVYKDECANNCIKNRTSKETCMYLRSLNDESVNRKADSACVLCAGTSCEDCSLIR